MTESLKRVIYCSSTDAGRELFFWLQGLPCDIVLAETDNRKISEYPPYDLGISFLYTHKIPASEFKIPFRWVNFHPGSLPEFRGRNLAYHAIMEDALHFGATLHYMDAEFDTGEIIEVVRFPILPQHTAGDLVRLAHAALVDLFKKYIPRLLDGKVPSEPQGAGRYFGKANIDDHLQLLPHQSRMIRAVTVAPRFYANVVIGDRHYRIVPADEGGADQSQVESGDIAGGIR